MLFAVADGCPNEGVLGMSPAEVRTWAISPCNTELDE